MNTVRASFSTLPDELLVQIASELFDQDSFEDYLTEQDIDEYVTESYSDMAAFRLVSRRCELAVTPYLFRWILVEGEHVQVYDWDPDTDYRHVPKISSSVSLSQFINALNLSPDLARHVEVLHVSPIPNGRTENLIHYDVDPRLDRKLKTMVRLRRLDIPNVEECFGLDSLRIAGTYIVHPDSYPHLNPLHRIRSPPEPPIPGLRELTVQLEFQGIHQMDRYPSDSPNARLKLHLPTSLEKLNIICTLGYTFGLVLQEPKPNLKMLEIRG